MKKNHHEIMINLEGFLSTPSMLSKSGRMNDKLVPRDAIRSTIRNSNKRRKVRSNFKRKKEKRLLKEFRAQKEKIKKLRIPKKPVRCIYVLNEKTRNEELISSPRFIDDIEQEAQKTKPEEYSDKIDERRRVLNFYQNTRIKPISSIINKYKNNFSRNKSNREIRPEESKDSDESGDEKDGEDIPEAPSVKEMKESLEDDLGEISFSKRPGTSSFRNSGRKINFYSLGKENQSYKPPVCYYNPKYSLIDRKLGYTLSWKKIEPRKRPNTTSTFGYRSRTLPIISNTRRRKTATAKRRKRVKSAKMGVSFRKKKFNTIK